MALTTVFLCFFIYFVEKQNIYQETFCRFNKLYDLCTHEATIYEYRCHQTPALVCGDRVNPISM